MAVLIFQDETECLPNFDMRIVPAGKADQQLLIVINRTLREILEKEYHILDLIGIALIERVDEAREWPFA